MFSVADVLADATAILVHGTKVVFRGYMSLPGRGCVLDNSLMVVTRNTLALFVEVPEGKFGVRRSLCGGLTIVLCRFPVAL